MPLQYNWTDICHLESIFHCLVQLPFASFRDIIMKWCELLICPIYQHCKMCTLSKTFYDHFYKALFL